MSIKVRASSWGDLMAGATSAGLTEKQAEMLATLQAKEKRTDKQEETMNELIAKRDAPFELSKGAKTCVEKIIKQMVYGYSKSFSSKETLKGIAVEDESILLYNEVFFTSHVKSESELECEFSKGHPDIEDEINKKIIDIKSPWSKETFPVFAEDAKNSGYEWQVKMYLYMKGGTKTGWTQGEIAYVLTDTPEELIPDWEPDDLHDMSNLPDRLRVTIVHVTLTEEDEKLIEQVGKAMQTYADEYLTKINNK